MTSGLGGGKKRQNLVCRIGPQTPFFFRDIGKETDWLTGLSETDMELFVKGIQRDLIEMSY